MLRRMIVTALLFGAIGAVYHLVRGLLSDSRPLWDTGLVVVMALVGFFGVYADHRRTLRAQRTEK